MSRNANTGREYTRTDEIHAALAAWEDIRDQEDASDEDERAAAAGMYDLLAKILYDSRKQASTSVQERVKGQWSLECPDCGPLEYPGQFSNPIAAGQEAVRHDMREHPTATASRK